MIELQLTKKEIKALHDLLWKAMESTNSNSKYDLYEKMYDDLSEKISNSKS